MMFATTTSIEEAIVRHHTHLTLEEREEIMCLRRKGMSITKIASSLGRSKSTISREIARNLCASSHYRASRAQARYRQRRKACHRHRLLDDESLFELVAMRFLEDQWSPEQIEGRLRLEGGPAISDSTIYRAIWQGCFNACLGGRKASRRLRRRGRRPKRGKAEIRGKIKVSHEISERPDEVDARSRLGDWEGDTVVCKRDRACLVTLVDRRSGMRVGGKVKKKRSEPVAKLMVRKLQGMHLHSITLDRGKEFAAHKMVTDKLGVEIYFALPHHPWQRGSNENTNGLLREYFPKGKSIDNLSVKEVQAVYDKLNLRPRKRLGYRTPYEAYYGKALHLI